MSRAPDWHDRLQMLVVRFSAYGIGPDVASLSLLQAWALYRFLSRLAGDA